MTSPDAYRLGDIVFAREALYNDGGIPDIAEDALLAAAGGRGVVVNSGHLAEDPQQLIYLVRFEDTEGMLGPPVGCLHDELSQIEVISALPSP